MPDSPFRTLPPALSGRFVPAFPNSPASDNLLFSIIRPPCSAHRQRKHSQPGNIPALSPTSPQFRTHLPNPLRLSSEHSFQTSPSQLRTPSPTSPPQFRTLPRTRPPYSAHRQRKHSQPEKRPGPVPSPRRSSEHTSKTSLPQPSPQPGIKQGTRASQFGSPHL